MHVDFLQSFFATSPAVRLIRSPHAFWIVDFLVKQFKETGQITRCHSELAAELDVYLERLKVDVKGLFIDGKSKSQEKADAFLTTWCSNSIGWLKRFIGPELDEPQYQLTDEFEKALAFVERASKELPFIGTESRLRSVLDMLQRVADGVEEDPQARVARLRAQRDEIDREIELTLQSPESTRMTPTQIRERFVMATQQLQQLKSEFRAVEDRFKEITRSVQQKILSANESRGDILQFALDSEDTLKQGDQGQSFFEFLKLLHSPENQDRINKLVKQLHQVDELASEHEDLSSLKSMVPTLISEAEKILRTTQQLSVTLRRLLDARSTRHHQQLSQVLRDILGAAAAKSENPPIELGLDVEVEIDIQCPMDRPFWEATEPFDEVELETREIGAAEQQAAFEQLAELDRLDWQLLRRQIADLTQQRGTISLKDLCEDFPIQIGAVEVLAYVQIAHEDGHHIDQSQMIELQHAGPLGRRLRVPNIVFNASKNAKVSL